MNKIRNVLKSEFKTVELTVLGNGETLKISAEMSKDDQKNIERDDVSYFIFRKESKCIRLDINSYDRLTIWLEGKGFKGFEDSHLLDNVNFYEENDSVFVKMTEHDYSAECNQRKNVVFILVFKY